MFNSFTGTVTSIFTEGLHLQTSGIEWQIQMPLIALSHYEVGQTDTRIFIYLLHREDRMSLYGFSTEKEREVFMELLKVNGIGPRQAIRILSSVSVTEFRTILDSGSINELVRIPGLGKASAQKILLALKGKLQLDTDDQGKEDDELVLSLAAMGFEQKAASKVVRQLMQELQDKDLNDEAREKELLRQAIVRLST